MPRERDVAGLPIRQSMSSEVVSDQRVLLRKQLVPRTPDQAVPIQFHVGDPRAYPDKGRPGTAFRVGDANAIGTLAEPYFLPGVRHVLTLARNKRQLQRRSHASVRRTLILVTAATPGGPHNGRRKCDLVISQSQQILLKLGFAHPARQYARAQLLDICPHVVGAG